ncbi:hypothetical protein [Fischerella sp. JS2]|nr:hypothetical protein [Fischerella sp. JS2]
MRSRLKLSCGCAITIHTHKKAIAFSGGCGIAIHTHKKAIAPCK